MRDGTSKSPSRPRSRRNLAVSGSACTALGRPAVEPYTGSPTMALRRDVAPASPVATRLPRTTRLRFALHGAQRRKDFAVTCQLVPGVPHLRFGSCTSPRAFGLGFLQTPPRDDALALLLAFGSSFTWLGDFHPDSSVPCPAHTFRSGFDERFCGFPEIFICSVESIEYRFSAIIGRCIPAEEFLNFLVELLSGTQPSLIRGAKLGHVVFHSYLHTLPRSCNTGGDGYIIASVACAMRTIKPARHICPLVQKQPHSPSAQDRCPCPQNDETENTL